MAGGRIRLAFDPEICLPAFVRQRELVRHTDVLDAGQSAELHLSVTAATSSGSVTAVTSADECSIAVSVESAIAFVGTFTCAGLPIGEGTTTVNASGVFSATA